MGKLGLSAASYSVGHGVRSFGATQMFPVTLCLSFPSQLSLLSSSVVSGGCPEPRAVPFAEPCVCLQARRDAWRTMKYMELFIVADHTLVSAGGAENQDPSLTPPWIYPVTLPHPHLSPVQEPEPQPGPHQAAHCGDCKLRGQGEGAARASCGPQGLSPCHQGKES